MIELDRLALIKVSQGLGYIAHLKRINDNYPMMNLGKLYEFSLQGHHSICSCRNQPVIKFWYLDRRYPQHENPDDEEYNNIHSNEFDNNNEEEYQHNNNEHEFGRVMVATVVISEYVHLLLFKCVVSL